MILKQNTRRTKYSPIIHHTNQSRTNKLQEIIKVKIDPVIRVNKQMLKSAYDSYSWNMGNNNLQTAKKDKKTTISYRTRNQYSAYN